MQGPPSGGDLKGVIPNAFSHIFEFVNSSKDIEFLIRLHHYYYYYLYRHYYYYYF